MQESPAAVFIVEEDVSVCSSLGRVLAAAGLTVEVFASAQAFLGSFDAERAGCLVLDIRLPGMSALELQQRLCELRAMVAIVFITGHGDVPMAVEAMQHGAVDFVQKPFKEQELVERVSTALDRDRANREGLKAPAAIRDRLQQLTATERAVLDLVTAGTADTQIAGALNLSARSVEIHRARIMEKMSASSLAHLVRMAIAAARLN